MAAALVSVERILLPSDFSPFAARALRHALILRVAAEKRADLVVIGAQGHGLIEHLLSGSNAQQVIRRATCPVLTVRPARIGEASKDKGAVGLVPKFMEKKP